MHAVKHTAWATLTALAVSTQAAEVGGVDFHPAFSPTAGLMLSVQNVSKLSQTLDAVDVFVGHDPARGGCRMALPPMTLGPAERSSVVIADSATFGGCVGASTVRGLARPLPTLAAVDLSATRATSPAERSQPLLRIEPRVDGAATATPLLFRVGPMHLPPRRRP